MYCEWGGGGGVCGKIDVGWVAGSNAVCVCGLYRDGRVVTCSCVMISFFLYFEDVFGRRNQGGHWRGGRKVSWKGCGNAATARGGHDTACKHSSVS